MIPQINFIYSPIYQEMLYNSTTKSEKYDYNRFKTFSEDYIKEIKSIWIKFEKKILKYIGEILNLKWNKSEINVYVPKISSILPFSDPLTIPIQLEAGERIFTLSHERFIDMLLHELIHNILIQNKERTEDYFTKFISKKYNEESTVTQSHILIHAVHKKIFVKFFNEDRLNLEIKMNDYYPEYKRSWEIVKEEGEDKIINEFKDYLGLTKAKA